MELEFYADEIVYVIDTSSLIMLDTFYKKSNPVFSAIWEEIEDLISKKCFKTIDFVEEEINKYEGEEKFLKEWMKTWKNLLVNETDINSILYAKKIVNEEKNTGFLKAKKQLVGIEEADPYLIAFCKNHNFVLITKEKSNKPNRIPAVSVKNGVKCIDIYDFLIERGLKMQRRK